MKYNKFIGSDNNFQTSVNLQYDLNKEEKIRGYIPTTQSLAILKRYLSAVCSDNNNEDNATVLIGPYGRGKSLLLLLLSAILSHDADSPVIAELIKKLTAVDSTVGELLNIFYSKKKHYLPIIINSNHTDINQSFIIALREALERNNLNDFFPETYFDSALKMINKWENEFENAIKLFKKQLHIRKLKLSDFKDQLNKCSASAYQIFCEIYPVVSNGASFNPLQNTDVVKMYEQVCDALIQQKSFSGVYIIFDELSKFLESSSAMANMQNLKLIQDFAEMAVRSNKMHLCCITHKEILDYSQSDSFRAVDGRFKKVYFVASSEQSYELVSNAIIHGEQFDKFYAEHKDELSSVTQRCQMTGIFSELSDDMYTEILEKKCFPIHPISVFSLIHISELVGQNERTLFTFLSQSEEHSFQSFLDLYPIDKECVLLTPEWIFDYFSELFRVEIFNPKIHSIWAKTQSAIRKCENEDQKKLIKILAVCKIISSDVFKATDMNLKAASNFSDDIYRNTIDSLASLHIITRRRDGIYEFLTANGVDIKKNIQNLIEQGLVKLDRPHILKEAYSTPYILARQHNAKMHIQRYFLTEFMEASDFCKYTGDFSEIKSTADGLLIYLISDNDEDAHNITDHLHELGLDESIVVCITDVWKDNDLLNEYQAACLLEKKIMDTDDHFREELAVYKYDLFKTIREIADILYSPSNPISAYYNSEKFLDEITKPLLLNRELSNICDRVYPATPDINNEMINKNKISAQIRKARVKTIDWILSHTDDIPVMDGYGPEVSILRSTIIVKHLNDNNSSDDESLNTVISTINRTITEAENKPASFGNIYKTLCSSPFGMKKGTIPVYLALCMRKNQDAIVLSFKGKEIPISGETLSQIESDPDSYTLYVEKGTQEKDKYLDGIISAFSQVDPSAVNNKCTFAAELLQTWFRGLSKFARDHTMVYNKEKQSAVTREMLKFKSQLLQYDINPHAFLFTDIPKYFDSTDDYVCTLERLRTFAGEYNSFIIEIKTYLVNKAKQAFDRTIKGSLSSIMKDWYNSLPETTQTHIFSSEVNGFLHFIKENTSFDDNTVISELAKSITMLAIEDWNDQLVDTFLDSIKSYIDIVNSFNLDEEESDTDGTIVLSLGYGGKVYENNITDTEISGIAETAMNNIESHLEEYGEAITAQERVAVLLKLLKKELEQL
ncbi:MAG: hypothetical protein LUI06_05920 [Ruminococcus sp.]|nr:hypothetical protein [Ruminococcus sp.]